MGICIWPIYKIICEENSSLKKSIDSIQLDGLSPSEQDKVRKMLWEERNAFADEDEIGCAQELVMEINSEDEVPVQKTYNSIPRHLYQAVKEHVQDLLNKGWIKKIKVCVVVTSRDSSQERRRY